LENLEGKGYLRELDLYERIMLQLILKKWYVRMWNGFIRSQQETAIVSCKHGNELPGYTKTGEFLVSLINYWPPKKDAFILFLSTQHYC
jgi:hypothetical protein